MRTYAVDYRTKKLIVTKREREKIMKIKLLLSLILGISLGASAELVEEWNFGDNGNFSLSLIHI